MSRNCFDTILSVLQVENPCTDKDQEVDPLRNVRGLVDAIHHNCMLYGQPHARVSLDKRMVKAKGRFGFRYVEISIIKMRHLLNLFFCY